MMNKLVLLLTLQCAAAFVPALPKAAVLPAQQQQQLVGSYYNAAPVRSPLYMVASVEASTENDIAVSDEPAAPVVDPEEELKKNKKNSVLLCTTLALNSGILNGLFLSGILGKVQAVGPVTDSWTKSAVGLAHGDITKAIFIAKVLLSFAGGAIAQGLFNPKMTPFDISPKVRTKPFLLGSSMMALSSYLVYSAFKAGTAVPQIAFFLVCATQGMQNSFSSFLTQNLCRTSHFTGTTTDLFTIIAQVLRGNNAMKFKIPIYSGLTAMFFTGGFLGVRWTKGFKEAAIILAMSSAWYFLASLPLQNWKKSITQRFQMQP